MKPGSKTLKEMFHQGDVIDESFHKFQLQFARHYRSGKLYSFRDWCGIMKDLFDIVECTIPSRWKMDDLREAEVLNNW